MEHAEITALAEVMVRDVRECIAEATAVPPDLAAQIASAVRMLHESPTLERETPPPPKVTRIERDEDGNFVPVYDDQSV